MLYYRPCITIIRSMIEVTLKFGHGTLDSGLSIEAMLLPKTYAEEKEVVFIFILLVVFTLSTLSQ